jgi:ribonuclease HI
VLSKIKSERKWFVNLDSSTYNLYTDGSCNNISKEVGGWAFILEQPDGSAIRECGVETNTTNNRMELQAVIEGLTQVPEQSTIDLYSDSQYVTRGINEWMHKWRLSFWETIKNPDLWETIFDLCSNRIVRANWIKGHNGHPQNEECDLLASAACADFITNREFFSSGILDV